MCRSKLIYLFIYLSIAVSSPMSLAQDRLEGYKPFKFAAYYRTGQDYHVLDQRYRPQERMHRTYFFKALEEDGPNGGLWLQRYVLSPHYPSKKTIFHGSRSGRVELGFSGIAYMSGLSETKEEKPASFKTASDLIPPFINGNIILGEDFLFPIFPRNGRVVYSGDEWKVQVPPLVVDDDHMLSLHAASSTLVQKWEDTVQVGDYRCAKIRFAMEEKWRSPSNHQDLLGQVTGVSYFSLEIGIPVVTSIEWKVEAKKGPIKRMKEASRVSISLVSVSGYEGESISEVPSIH